jgi:hypothetical protein
MRRIESPQTLDSLERESLLVPRREGTPIKSWNEKGFSFQRCSFSRQLHSASAAAS